MLHIAPWSIGWIKDVQFSGKNYTVTFSALKSFASGCAGQMPNSSSWLNDAKKFKSIQNKIKSMKKFSFSIPDNQATTVNCFLCLISWINFWIVHTCHLYLKNQGARVQYPNRLWALCIYNEYWMTGIDSWSPQVKSVLIHNANNNIVFNPNVNSSSKE